MEDFYGEGHCLIWVNRPSPKQYSPSEEEYRQIQASIHHAQDFQEIMQRLDTILATPIPHKEPLSALIPCNNDPWPLSEIKHSSDGHPIYGETSCNPGQASNSAPTTLNSRSISSHPIISMAGGKPLVLVLSVPSNAEGKPLVQPTLPTNGIVTNNRQTSTV